MHCPRNSEVKNNSAFKSYKACAEVVNTEKRRISGVFVVIIRVCSEEIGGITRNGKGLRIADCVKHHIERITSDIAERTESCSFIFNKCSSERCGNTFSSSAAGLYVINFAKLARFNNLFNHLHIGVKSRLEAYRQNFAALFLCLADFNRFIKRYAHRLFQNNVYAVLQSINCALCVRSVVGANAYCVKLFVVDKLFVIVIAANVFNTVFFKKFLCLAVYKVCAANDFNVGHFFELLNVCVRNPARSYNTNLQFFGGVDCGFLLILFKLIQNIIVSQFFQLLLNYALENERFLCYTDYNSKKKFFIQKF